MTTHRITVQVRGWDVDYSKYSSVPRSIYFTAVIRSVPKNLKELNYMSFLAMFQLMFIQERI